MQLPALVFDASATVLLNEQKHIENSVSIYQEPIAKSVKAPNDSNVIPPTKGGQRQETIIEINLNASGVLV